MNNFEEGLTENEKKHYVSALIVVGCMVAAVVVVIFSQIVR